MYYGLSNFYQNHRRYVKSRDDSQLNGDPTALLVSKMMKYENVVSMKQSANCLVRNVKNIFLRI